MNRILAILFALCFSVAIPAAALAAPSGQGYTPPKVQTTTGVHAGVGMGQSMTTTGQTTTTMHQTMGTGVAVGISGTVGTTSTMYSAGRVAPVVPRGATEMSRTATTTGTMVTYNANGVVYRVTYAPNGKYQYTVGGSYGASQNLSTGMAVGTPGTTRSTGTYTGSSLPVTGSTLPVTGVTRLPVTGGGSAPVQPALPLLLALGLMGAGILVRRMSLSGQ